MSFCAFVQVCERTGDLLVCDSHCYSAFHPHCIGLSVAPKGKFVCRECKTGRYTMYLTTVSAHTKFSHTCGVNYFGFSFCSFQVFTHALYVRSLVMM